MTGTLINAGAIAVGAGLGTLLGGRVSRSVRSTVTDALGVFVVVLGISDALATFGDELGEALGSAAVLVILGSLLVGGVLGELIDVEARLTTFGTWLRDRVMGGREPMTADASGPDRDALEDAHPVHDPRHRFVEGFVVTSLLVCVGPLAILGPLQDGLTGDVQLLAVKAMLDGFAALAFASVLGIGVAFAVLPLLVLQGSITLAAGALQGVVTPPMLAAIGAVGGFLVLGIGLRLLEIRPIRVANLLPSLLLAPLAVALWP
jgi:uncharacterized protein